MSNGPISCDNSNSLTSSPDSPLSERELRKAQRRDAWKKTERKLTPENTTEFVLYSLLSALVLLGFSGLLSLFFDWADFGLLQVGMALTGGFFVTLGSVHGQKMRDALDEQERERHGFTLDNGRKASDGAQPLR